MEESRVEALNNMVVIRGGVILKVTVECVMVVEGGATDDEDDEDENDTDVKEGKVTDNVDMGMIEIVMPPPRK